LAQSIRSVLPLVVTVSLRGRDSSRSLDVTILEGRHVALFLFVLVFVPLLLLIGIRNGVGDVIPNHRLVLLGGGVQWCLLDLCKGMWKILVVARCGGAARTVGTAGSRSSKWSCLEGTNSISKACILKGTVE